MTADLSASDPSSASTSPGTALQTRPDLAAEAVRLPSGRHLGVSAYGDPDGRPVFFFHGWPGSRREPAFFEFPGLRLLAVDRPGYGLSDPSPERTLADWPRDIAALADRLGIQDFGVVGISGGGPYAAACAALLGSRVSDATLICPLGPPEAEGMASAKIAMMRRLGRGRGRTPIALGIARQILLARGAERHLARLRRLARGRNPDAKALQGGFGDFLVGSWREGLRASADGMLSDARIYDTPWPFRLEDIAVPMRIWHGEADPIVPVSVGRHYAARVPGIAARFIPHEGHVSIITNHLSAILADMAGLAPRIGGEETQP